MICCLLITLLFYTFTQKTLSGPITIYNGSSTIILVGQTNWTLKYPLKLCKDLNWTKTMNIDATRNTGEGDLVMAFGTITQYFALAISYDGTLVIKSGSGYTGGGFVAPQSGSPLYNVSSLQQQYATSTNFRTSLIPSANAAEWSLLAGSATQMSNNNLVLKIDISGDRINDNTNVTITKGNIIRNIYYTSTWSITDNVFFYMGLDASNTEQFTLRKIQSTDGCTTLTFPPSNEPTHQPTHDPTSVAAPYINCDDENIDIELCNRYPDHENIPKTCQDVYGLEIDVFGVNTISSFAWFCIFLVVIIMLLLITELLRFYKKKKKLFSKKKKKNKT
eukprot:374167_1